MAHVRKQIRDKLKTLLTGLTTTGANVFDSRGLVMQENELPGLVILTNDETITTLDVHGEALERSITISIIARAKSASAVDDVLDQMIAEIEAKIETNNTLDGVCKSLQLSAINIDITDDQETDIGQAILQYQSVYYTQAGAPEVYI